MLCISYTCLFVAVNTAELDTYANTAGPRPSTDVGKDRKRRKPEPPEETPKLLSLTEAKVWASRMTFRPRRQLPGTWICFRMETQRFWPVAVATDTEALEAQLEVVVTRSVSRFEIICDWEGTNTHGTEPCKGYDQERIHDSQTGTTCRRDGLSYGSWSCFVTFLLEWQSVHRKGTSTGNITPLPSPTG